MFWGRIDIRLPSPVVNFVVVVVFCCIQWLLFYVLSSRFSTLNNDDITRRIHLIIRVDFLFFIFYIFCWDVVVRFAGFRYKHLGFAYYHNPQSTQVLLIRQYGCSLRWHRLAVCNDIYVYTFSSIICMFFPVSSLHCTLWQNPIGRLYKDVQYITIISIRKVFLFRSYWFLCSIYMFYSACCPRAERQLLRGDDERLAVDPVRYLYDILPL